MSRGSPSESKSHRTARAWIVAGSVLVAAALIAGLLLWLLNGPTAFVDLAPSQIVAKAEVNALRSGSALVAVHVVHGSQTQMTADVTNRTAGYQVITAGDEFAQIVVVDGIAYVRGNSSALTKYFDLPGPDGPRLAGHWISIRPSDVGYAEVTSGITLGSVLQGVVPTGTLHTGARIRLHGVNVISVTGASGKKNETVFVEATGAHLPIAAVQESGSGTSHATATIQFSRWGKRVAIKAPRGAIPIASFTAPTTTTTPTLPGS